MKTQRVGGRIKLDSCHGQESSFFVTATSGSCPQEKERKAKEAKRKQEFTESIREGYKNLDVQEAAHKKQQAQILEELRKPKSESATKQAVSDKQHKVVENQKETVKVRQNQR